MSALLICSHFTPELYGEWLRLWLGPCVCVRKRKKKFNSLLEVGFEPTHPKITELKSAALDRSAIQALENFLVENPGFDPGASSLLTTRSTN